MLIKPCWFWGVRQTVRSVPVWCDQRSYDCRESTQRSSSPRSNRCRPANDHWTSNPSRHNSRCTSDNRVTVTFDLLTSFSPRGYRLPWTIRIPSLVLIAQVVFLLKRGQTDTQTKSQTLLITVHTHRPPPAWIMSLHERTRITLRINCHF